MIPHLTTALTGPLQDLETRILNGSTEIEHWFRGQWQEHTPPFYGVVARLALLGAALELERTAPAE